MPTIDEAVSIEKIASTILNQVLPFSRGKASDRIKTATRRKM